MPLEESLDLTDSIAVSVNDDELQRPSEILENRIPPLLLRSPPHAQAKSRSITPELGTLSSFGENNVNDTQNVNNNSNFNLDFAFDLNDFDENADVGDDLCEFSTQIAANRNLLVESSSQNFNLEEKKSNTTESSNWADFDSKPLSSNETFANETQKNEIKNVVQVKEEEKNCDNKNDDDEWADFVDNNANPTIGLKIPNEVMHNESKSKLDTNQIGLIEKNESPTPLPVKNKDFSEQIVLDNLVNQMFTNLNLNVDFSETDKIQEMFIDDNETWKQLKTYTSVIDASISLQFKWNLSCLEENCLNSLNLTRIENSQTRESRNVHISNLLSNEILKPTKLEMTSILPSNNTTTATTNSTAITNSNENNFSLIDVNLDKKKQMVAQLPVPLPTSPSPQILYNYETNSQQLAPLDIDLSYFEKKLESNSSSSSFSSSSSSSLSSKNGQSSTTSNNTYNVQKTNNHHLTNKESSNQAKREPNAKLYLDKLLQDIFNKNNSGNNNNNLISNNDITLVKSNSASTFNNQLTTKSDVFSDQKLLSNSSSSLPSSSNELSVQLNPKLLEQQQYLNIIHANKTKDRRALEIITKFPANSTFNNSLPKKIVNQQSLQNVRK